MTDRSAARPVVTRVGEDDWRAWREVRLPGAADAARRPPRAGNPSGDTDDGADIRRITAVAREALGEAAFAAEVRHGRRLRPRQASSL